MAELSTWSFLQPQPSGQTIYCCRLREIPGHCLFTRQRGSGVGAPALDRGSFATQPERTIDFDAFCVRSRSSPFLRIHEGEREQIEAHPPTLAPTSGTCGITLSESEAPWRACTAGQQPTSSERWCFAKFLRPTRLATNKSASPRRSAKKSRR